MAALKLSDRVFAKLMASFYQAAISWVAARPASTRRPALASGALFVGHILSRYFEVNRLSVAIDFVSLSRRIRLGKWGISSFEQNFVDRFEDEVMFDADNTDRSYDWNTQDSLFFSKELVLYISGEEQRESQLINYLADCIIKFLDGATDSEDEAIKFFLTPMSPDRKLEMFKSVFLRQDELLLEIEVAADRVASETFLD